MKPPLNECKCPSDTRGTEAKGRIRVLHVNYSLRLWRHTGDRTSPNKNSRIGLGLNTSSLLPASGPVQTEYETLGARALVAGEDEIVHLADKYGADLVLTHTVQRYQSMGTSTHLPVTKRKVCRWWPTCIVFFVPIAYRNVSSGDH